MGGYEWPTVGGDAGGGREGGLPLEAQVSYLMNIVRDFLLPQLASLAPAEFLDYGPGVSADAPLHGGSAAEEPPPWMPPFHADPVGPAITGGPASATVHGPPAYAPIGACRVITALATDRVDIQVLETASGLTSGAKHLGVYIPTKVENPAVGDWGTAWRTGNGDVIFFPESPTVAPVGGGCPSGATCNGYSEYLHTTAWSGVKCGGSVAAAACAQALQIADSSTWTPDGPGNTDLTVSCVDKGAGEVPRYVWRAVVSHGAVNGAVADTYEKSAVTGSTPDGIYTKTTSNCSDSPTTVEIELGDCP